MPADLIVGRVPEVRDLMMHLDEGVHVLVTGARRIGKTTVCRAACSAAGRAGATVIAIEVPERNDSRDLLQTVIDRCASASLRDERGKVLRALRPLIDEMLRNHGVPLDLSEVGTEPSPATTRAILALPLQIASELGNDVVLFLDELQRVVSYADGDVFLSDLLDLYGGQTDVTVLVDGSDERAVDGLLGAPGHIGKLCERYPLPSTIDIATWREPLKQRFASVDMTVRPDCLEDLLAFGAGRPYETMLACRHAALTARRLTPDGTVEVGRFETQSGIDGAEAQLRDDGA